MVAQSVDHKTLCLSFFTRSLLGIPQRRSGVFFSQKTSSSSYTTFVDFYELDIDFNRFFATDYFW
ncbi:hypothetical protein ACSF25_004497, partial [Salmonella enterica subsp. enterica serovar Infantis]